VSAELACELELHERLTSLLTELEPYEQKLIQLNKKMKIKLRKEHENYVEEPLDKQQVIFHVITGVSFIIYEFRLFCQITLVDAVNSVVYQS